MKRMTKAKLIGVITIIVAALLVILQNRQPVETRFLFITITMPNAVLLGLTLLVGVVTGGLIVMIMLGKRGGTTRR